MGGFDDFISETLRKPEPLKFSDVVSEATAPPSGFDDLVFEATQAPGASLEKVTRPSASMDESLLLGATNFVSDQFDPINIAMFAVSMGGWSLGGKLAAKAGFTALKSIGTTELGSEIFASSLSGRLIHRAASGLGGAIPFALGEAIETPQAGETRMGNFARELLSLEAIDLALAIPIGGAANRLMGRNSAAYHREASAATLRSAKSAALKKGMSSSDATAAAFASVLQSKIKQAEDIFGPGVAAKILEGVDRLASSSPDDLANLVAQQARGLRSSPEIARSLQQNGIPPEAIDDVLRKLESERRIILDSRRGESTSKMNSAFESMDKTEILNQQTEVQAREHSIKAAGELRQVEAARKAFALERGREATQAELTAKMEELFPMTRPKAGGFQSEGIGSPVSPNVKLASATTPDLPAIVENYMKADGDLGLMAPAFRAQLEEIKKVPALANRFSTMLREKMGQSLPGGDDVHPLVRDVIEKEKARLGVNRPPIPRSSEGPLGPPRDLVSPTATLPSEEGYVYHATNEDNLLEIRESGVVKTFDPSHGTDQSRWPDGSIRKRSYWNAKAGTVHSFAPAEGRSVIIRTKKTGAFGTEATTRDIYARHRVPAGEIEVLTKNGWVPLIAKSSSRVEPDLVPLLDSFAKDAGILKPKASYVPTPEAGRTGVIPSQYLGAEGVPTAYVIHDPRLNAPRVTTDPQEVLLNELAGGSTVHVTDGDSLVDAKINALSFMHDEERKLLERNATESLASDMAADRARLAQMRKLGLSQTTTPPLTASGLGEASGESAIDDLISRAQQGESTTFPDAPTVTRSLDGQVHISPPRPPDAAALNSAEANSRESIWTNLEKESIRSPQPKGPCPSGDII